MSTKLVLSRTRNYFLRLGRRTTIEKRQSNTVNYVNKNFMIEKYPYSADFEENIMLNNKVSVSKNLRRTSVKFKKWMKEISLQYEKDTDSF